MISTAADWHGRSRVSGSRSIKTKIPVFPPRPLPARRTDGQRYRRGQRFRSCRSCIAASSPTARCGTGAAGRANFRQHSDAGRSGSTEPDRAFQNARFASTGPAGRGETFPVHPHGAATSRGTLDLSRVSSSIMRAAPAPVGAHAASVPDRQALGVRGRKGVPLNSPTGAARPATRGFSAGRGVQKRGVSVGIGQKTSNLRKSETPSDPGQRGFSLSG